MRIATTNEIAALDRNNHDGVGQGHTLRRTSIWEAELGEDRQLLHAWRRDGKSRTPLTVRCHSPNSIWGRDEDSTKDRQPYSRQAQRVRDVGLWRSVFYHEV
ncbi:MAG: hypothetical protein ACK54P_02970 [Bacteroidota bacterium]